MGSLDLGNTTKSLQSQCYDSDMINCESVCVWGWGGVTLKTALQISNGHSSLVLLQVSTDWGVKKHEEQNRSFVKITYTCLCTALPKLTW